MSASHFAEAVCHPGGHAWGAGGWLVIAVWTVVLAALATHVYQRDTGRM